jgi:hypothetical protein
VGGEYRRALCLNPLVRQAPHLASLFIISSSRALSASGVTPIERTLLALVCLALEARAVAYSHGLEDWPSSFPIRTII